MKKTKKEENNSELRKFQLTLVEILDEIVRLCKKHNLTYFLLAGSALGAVRHAGFIPWDDDIDIGMPREDYEKLIKIALDELDDKYFLDCYKTNKYAHLGFMKIKKNGTSAITDYSKIRRDHDGFSIDIFPIDYNQNKDSLGVSLVAHLTRSILEVIKVRNHNISFKGMRHKIICLPFFLLTNYRIQKIVNYLYQKDNKKEHINCAIYSNIYHYKKDIYPYDVVFPAKEVTFEGKKYYVYHDVDKYLTGLYGDYMKLPKEENRVSHSFSKLDYQHGMVLNTKEEYNKINRK